MAVTNWTSEGWHHWLDIPPPARVLIEITREYALPRIMYPEEMWPEANIWGLYWRLTGIGREQLYDRNERFDPAEAYRVLAMQLSQSR